MNFLGYEITTNQTETGYQAIATTTTYRGHRWRFESPTERDAIALARAKVAEDFAISWADNTLTDLNPALQSCRLVFICGAIAKNIVRAIPDRLRLNLFCQGLSENIRCLIP
jgi:hypothetical protein